MSKKGLEFLNLLVSHLQILLGPVEVLTLSSRLGLRQGRIHARLSRHDVASQLVPLLLLLRLQVVEAGIDGSLAAGQLIQFLFDGSYFRRIRAGRGSRSSIAGIGSFLFVGLRRWLLFRVGRLCGRLLFCRDWDGGTRRGSRRSLGTIRLHLWGSLGRVIRARAKPSRNAEPRGNQNRDNHERTNGDVKAAIPAAGRRRDRCSAGRLRLV